MNVIQKLILKKDPNHDFGRYRFIEGDITTDLKSGAKILIDYSAISYVKCFALTDGIDVKKGDEYSVSYDNLERTTLYIKPAYEVTKDSRYEPGDIVEIGGTLFIVIKNDGNKYITGKILQTKLKHMRFGERYCVPIPERTDIKNGE